MKDQQIVAIMAAILLSKGEWEIGELDEDDAERAVESARLLLKETKKKVK